MSTAAVGTADWLPAFGKLDGSACIARAAVASPTAGCQVRRAHGPIPHSQLGLIGVRGIFNPIGLRPDRRAGGRLHIAGM